MTPEVTPIPTLPAFRPETVELSFILVNYFSSADLGRCLRTIQHSEPAGTSETLVVDNSVGDPGLDHTMREQPEVRWIMNRQNVGFARANNQAAREASGDFLVFINPDVTLAPETIRVLRNYLEDHPEAALVAPKVLNEDGSLQYSCRRFPTPWSGLFNRYSLLTRWFPNNPYSRHYLMTDYDHMETRPVDWVSGCCFMIRKKDFLEAGLFDEHYFLFIEDVDLCKTLHDMGRAVIYHPATSVIHRISSSNHRVPARIILKRHLGMSYYHHKNIPAHFFTQAIWDLMIALRCGLHLILNIFR